MPTESNIIKCPKCGTAMNFVCFVDKRTKEVIPPTHIEKGHTYGGFLSGTSPMYRCPNDGHEETNE